MSVMLEFGPTELPTYGPNAPVIQISDELVIQAQAGDEQAREETMGLSMPIAYQVARRFSTLSANVDDIAYSGLEKVYTQGLVRKLYRAPGNFNGWVSRVVQNKACDIVQRDKIVSITAVDPVDFRLLNTADPHSTEQLANPIPIGENIQTIMELAAVKPDFAQPYILRHVDGYSYEEIATMLGVKTNTIRTRINRAKELLKTHKAELADFLGFGALSDVS